MSTPSGGWASDSVAVHGGYDLHPRVDTVEPGAPQVAAAEPKEILFDNLSRARLQAGINKVADAVGVTLGPRGDTTCPQSV